VLTEPRLRERVALEVLARRSMRTSEPDAASSAMRRRFHGEPWFEGARVQVEIEEERLAAFANPDREVGRFSGLVGTPELAPVVRELFRFDAEHPLSASELRRFANCAFQGFLAYALRLGEREQPGEELDARVQGDFWHKVLELLFPRLKARGLLGKPADEVPDALLDEALEAAVRAMEQRAHVGHPALWRIDHDRARGMVRRLLNAEEHGLPFEGHLPEHTELRFGSRGAPEAWRHVAIPGGPGEVDIYVQGKIDRIDTGEGSLAVVDYKRSLKEPKRLREELLSVEAQLPLYLVAARASGHPGALKAAWLGLKDGRTRTIDEILARHDGPPLEDLLSTDPVVRKRLEAEGVQNLANALHALVAGLAAGRFPIHARDCEGCAYRAVCRISERRLEEGAPHDDA
jgi:RecB family exonuclease